MSNWIIVISGIAFAMLALIFALVFFMQSRRAEQTEEVVGRLGSGPAQQAEQSRNAVERIRNPIVRAITLKLWKAGLEVEPGRVGMVLLLLLLAVALLLILLGPTIGALVMAGLIVLGYILLVHAGSRRQIQITEQLPAFLDHVLRALVAGNTMEEAFAGAAREAPEPSRALFLSVSRQVRLGAPIDEVLAETGQMQGIRDLEILALATRTNRRYGGSMRRVVKSLVTTIRQRDMAARELRALTAETRVSAVVLAIIPIALSAWLLIQNPAYYTEMWQVPLGRLLLIAGVALQLTGIVVIWRMMNSSEDI